MVTRKQSESMGMDSDPLFAEGLPQRHRNRPPVVMYMQLGLTDA